MSTVMSVAVTAATAVATAMFLMFMIVCYHSLYLFFSMAKVQRIMCNRVAKLHPAEQEPVIENLGMWNQYSNRAMCAEPRLPVAMRLNKCCVKGPTHQRQRRLF
jgi:hypothetical protein